MLIIESSNRAAERMFGYAHGELIGRKLNLLMLSSHRERHSEYLEEYRRSPAPRLMETRQPLTALRKDGTPFTVEVAISQVQLGDRVFFTGIVRDRTERELLEAKLAQAQQGELKEQRSDLEIGARI